MLWLLNFCEDQMFVDIVGFLSMKIYVVLYTQCLRCNICSTWFLDIRISTYFHCGHLDLSVSKCGPCIQRVFSNASLLYLVLRDQQDCLQRDSNSIWCLGMSELFPGHYVKQTATSISSDCLSNEA